MDEINEISNDPYVIITYRGSPRIVEESYEVIDIEYCEVVDECQIAPTLLISKNSNDF